MSFEDSRPGWTSYYLGIAKEVSRRGDCRRSQVGAVVVTPEHIALFGYNGTDSHGQPGCLVGACPRGLKSYSDQPAGGSYADCIGIHAEHNALRKAAKADVSLIGATAYVTREPCNNCYRLLVNAGVVGVYWRRDEMWTPGGSPGYTDLADADEQFLIWTNQKG